MLKVSGVKTKNVPVALSPDEDRKLRLAFGRFAQEQNLKAGQAVVASYYAGHQCFHCDCRPDMANAPLLYLITATHIRRETDGEGTPHRDNCEFALDAKEQRTLVRSYKIRKRNNRCFNLLRNFRDDTDKPVTKTDYSGFSTKSPALATVMRELLHEAKLDHIFSKEPVWGALINAHTKISF